MSSKVKGRRRFRYAPDETPIAASEPWSLFPTAPEDSLGWVGVGPVQMGPWGCGWGICMRPRAAAKAANRRKSVTAGTTEKNASSSSSPVPTRRAVLPLSTGEHAARNGRLPWRLPIHDRHTPSSKHFFHLHTTPRQSEREQPRQNPRGRLSLSIGGQRAQHSR